MNPKQLQSIIIEANVLQNQKRCEQDKILILLKEGDFQSLFNQLSMEIIKTNEIIVPTMYKCYGFEVRPHNIENQDVLICLKHKVK